MSNLTAQQTRVLVFNAAETRRPPTYMILAQAMIESGYNALAVNLQSGASGVLQIMRVTASGPGFGVAPLALADRLDPTKSTLFCCDYLTALYDDPSTGMGSWARSLLLYNVGPFANINNASGGYKALASLVAMLQGEPQPIGSAGA
jgi:hypothetical protein